MISPCVKLCVIDPETALCAGCARTLAEITGWSSFSDAEREQIMQELPQRRVRMPSGSEAGET